MEKDAPSGKDGHADRPRAIAEDSAPDVRPDALLAALIRWLTEANPLPPDEYLAQVREMLDSFACILHPDHRTNRPEQSH